MKYTFETALVWLKRGYRIRRLAWKNHAFRQLGLRDGSICTFIGEEIVNLGCPLWGDDVLAEDWIVEEKALEG